MQLAKHSNDSMFDIWHDGVAYTASEYNKSMSRQTGYKLYIGVNYSLISNPSQPSETSVEHWPRDLTLKLLVEHE